MLHFLFHSPSVYYNKTLKAQSEMCVVCLPTSGSCTCNLTWW